MKVSLKRKDEDFEGWTIKELRGYERRTVYYFTEHRIKSVHVLALVLVALAAVVVYLEFYLRIPQPADSSDLQYFGGLFFIWFMLALGVCALTSVLDMVMEGNGCFDSYYYR